MNDIGRGIGVPLLAMAVSCASSTVGPGDTRVSLGTWGGNHAGLTVTETGAHLELDCAHGDISQTLMLDGNGNLAVDGVFVQEHGGPIRVGEDENKQPARYAGKVKGDSMMLDVTLIASQEKVGTFTLTYKASPRITKCL